LGPEIFYRIGFGAVIDQTHEVKEIQRRQKQNITALNPGLSQLAEVVIVLQSSGFEASEQKKSRADHRAVWMGVFSWP
jgi:hypothetical protein